jgi:putative spermidine/putrescine transport system ATP-binding protein
VKSARARARIEDDVASPNSSHALRSEAALGLKLVDVAKSYGRVKALDGISLDVKAGEFLTILGASGSGKTTLLKIISGFETLDRGSVQLGERDITGISPSKRNIGMVFQNYALFPHMSVAENVGFPLAMRRVPADAVRNRVEETLALVELSGFEQRRPHQLSGGQQQRVALARAILFQPSLLLLDEPFGALDRKLRETMQLEVRNLQRQLSLTTVFITHDQEEALIMSDRIAVVGNGRLWQIGTPEEVYTRPVTRDVANFIGESNILSAGVQKVSEGGATITLPFGGPVEILPGKMEAVAGRQANVMVRPENVMVGAAQSEGKTVSAVGTVVETIYIGLSVKFRLRMETGEEILARVNPGQPEVSARPGERLPIFIDAESIRLLSA